MEGVLQGWGEIAKYLRLHPRTAQRYENSRNLPVQRAPGGGPKAPVFALRSDLDEWLLGVEGDIGGASRTKENAWVRSELAAPVLERIVNIGRDTKLYRRSYVLRFDLKRSSKGLEAHIGYSFEVCNASEKKEPFVQEFTMDKSEKGHVESMAFWVNGKPVYELIRPAPAQEFTAYVSYQGPKQWIRPTSEGMTYVCRASWVIRPVDNDIWYNHMILPTIGVTFETHAPAGFEITTPFSLPGLVMKGEHLDISWRKMG